MFSPLLNSTTSSMAVDNFDSRQSLGASRLRSVLAVVLCLFLTVSTSISFASPACSSVFSISTAQRLSPLRQALSSNFSNFPAKSVWLSYPLQESITQKLVNSLLQLNAAERAQALKELQQAPPKDKTLNTTLLLALYDHPTWERFFNRFTRGPLADDSLVNSLVPVLRRMPNDLRDYFYEKIRLIYPNLSKRNFTLIPFRTELRLAPKRAVDAFIQHTMHADEMILQEFQISRDPLKAYQSYFDFLKAKFFSESVKGDYRTEDVLTVGRSIQAVLRSKASQFKDPYVIVTGSLPNGRADLRSADLDSQLSSRDLMNLFPEMDERINRDLSVKYPHARLHLEAMRELTTPHFTAQINPVLLKISLTKIELQIYPAFSPLSRDKTLMPFNYESPRTLLLEESRSPVTPLSSAQNFKNEKPELRAWVDNGYLGIPAPSRWLENPYREPQTQALVDQILQLNLKDRLEILQKIQNNPPRDKALEKILRLSLFDELTWLEYFEEFSQKPQDNDALFNALVPVFSKMPQSLRSILLQKAHEVYPTASRVKSVREFPFYKKNYLRLAPKRALDVLISNLLPPRKEIRQKIERGQSVLQAYQEVLQYQKKSVFAGYSQGSYSASDVLIAARAIQSVMHQRETTDPTWTVTMGGSFPSGRAKLETSDIDVMLSDSRYNQHLEEMTSQVNEALKATHPESALEVHSFFETTTEVNAAIVSPMFIRISKDRIELLVYPPIRSLERDEHQLPQNYEAPDVYLLEELEVNALHRAG